MDSRVEQQFAKIETRFDRIKLIYSWQNEKLERSMEFQSHGLSVLCMDHQLFKILTLVSSHYSYSTTFSKVKLATVIRLWRSGILATQCRWATQDCITSDQPGPACSAFGSPAHESPNPQHRPLCLTLPLWFLDLSRVAPKTKHLPYPPQGQPTTTSSSPPPPPRGPPLLSN